MLLKIGPSLGVVAAGVLSGISILSLFVSRPFSGRTGQEMDETYKDIGHMTAFFSDNREEFKGLETFFQEDRDQDFTFHQYAGSKMLDGGFAYHYRTMDEDRKDIYLAPVEGEEVSSLSIDLKDFLDLMAEKKEIISVVLHGDQDVFDPREEGEHYLEVRCHEGDEIASYLYMPSGTIKTLDREQRVELGDGWYYSIYGYVPIRLRAPSSVTITGTMDVDGSYLLESDTPETEMICIIPDTPEERTISAIAETGEETVSTSPETQAEKGAERPHAIEGIPSYENEGRFPTDMVFASQGSVRSLADIYEEIGSEGEFQPGDETVYGFYRQKFAALLAGKVKIYDPEGNESSLYGRYVITRGHQVRIQGGDGLYFFYMDGDGLPELCVQGTSGTYVCKYDADLDRYTEWWGTTNSGCMILGTRRMGETHNGDTERLFLFDKDGYMKCKIKFDISYRYEGIRLYLVSVPDLEERVRAGQIPDTMKEQIVYSEVGSTYYLRVTGEQYEGLIKGLHEAEKKAEKQQVPFSYFFDPED